MIAHDFARSAARPALAMSLAALAVGFGTSAAHASGADSDSAAGSSDASAILVTGARAKTPGQVGDVRQETAPATRATLDAAQLEKLAGIDGAVTGALKLLPGVHFGGGDSSGVSEGTFTIRGFSQDQIGFARDGVPLNDPIFLTPHVDFMGDPENYASVSVLYGAGSNDVPSFTTSGGSVDITTVAPEKEFGVLVKQAFGNDDLRRTFVRVNSGEYHGLSAWVSGSLTSGQLWTEGGGEIWSRRFEGDLQYKWGDGNQINFIASDFRMRTNAYYHPTLAQYRSEPYDQGYSSAIYPTGGGTNGVADIAAASSNSRELNRADFPIQTYAVNAKFNLASNLQLRVDPYYVRVNHGVASVAGTALPESLVGRDLNGDGDLLDTRPLAIGVYPIQHRVGATARLNWAPASNNHAEIGIWYDHVNTRYQLIAETIGANGAPTSQTGSGVVIDAAGQPVDFTDQHDIINTRKLWAQDSWDFLPGWNAVASLAWHHSWVDGANEAGLLTGSYYENRATYDKVLPSFALTFQASQANQFYYDITSNMRIPAAASLFQGATSFTPEKAETTLNQELGWRYSTPHVLLSAGLFLDYFHNREVSYEALSGVTSYFNAGNVTSRGADVTLNGKLPANFTYSASWTHVIAKQKSDYTLGGYSAPTAGKQLFNTPKDVLTGGIGYDDGRFYGNFLGRYDSSFYGDLANTERLPGYATFDIAAGYRFDHLSRFFKKVVFSLNINNLFDKQAVDNAYSGTVSANASSYFYAAPTYSRLAPRTVLGNITLQL